MNRKHKPESAELRLKVKIMVRSPMNSVRRIFFSHAQHCTLSHAVCAHASSCDAVGTSRGATSPSAPFAERSDAPVHSACRIERAKAGSSRTLSDEAPAALVLAEVDDEVEDEDEDDAARSEDFCSNWSARMRFSAARARSAASALPGATHASSSVLGLGHLSQQRLCNRMDGRTR